MLNLGLSDERTGHLHYVYFPRFSISKQDRSHFFNGIPPNSEPFTKLCKRRLFRIDLENGSTVKDSVERSKAMPVSVKNEIL